MVLITDENDGGGSSPGKIKRIQHSKITGTTAQVYPTITEEPLDIANDHDEYLGSYLSVCDEEDYEEYDQFSTLPDKKSVISDDSFYPPDSDFADSERTPSPASPQTLSFFQACCNNNADAIKIKIRQGVTKEQVLETDKNSRPFPLYCPPEALHTLLPFLLLFPLYCPPEALPTLLPFLLLFPLYCPPEALPTLLLYLQPFPLYCPPEALHTLLPFLLLFPLYCPPEALHTLLPFLLLFPLYCSTCSPSHSTALLKLFPLYCPPAALPTLLPSCSSSHSTTLLQLFPLYYPPAALPSLLPSCSSSQSTTLLQLFPLYYPPAALPSLLPSCSSSQSTTLLQLFPLYCPPAALPTLLPSCSSSYSTALPAALPTLLPFPLLFPLYCPSRCSSHSTALPTAPLTATTGLMVACYHGYMDVVIALSQCPHLDVNWQDTEGNTALITAAQAGHATITNYLLNYFSGLDIEKSNCHGFTALMKAAMQGRVDCVRALIMAGADLQARDDGRSLTPREWALFTGRYETAFVMQQLNQQPCPEQCRESYRPEWPLLPALVDNAQRPKGCIQKISEVLRNVFNVGNVTEARKDGVLDHMVHVTTALGSPFVAVACRTVCPGSPPCVGKRRYSVQEILKQEWLQSMKDFGPANPDNPCVLLGPKSPDWCTGLQLCTTCDPDKACPPAPRRSPLHRVRRSSVQPGLMLPKLRISRAPTPTYKPEPERKKNGGRSGQFLQVPKWRYKELKEERKKAEEAERKRLEVVTRRHLHSGKRK
ncbi:hypothetical protein P4O66_005072 [Electrophorus voltai]|uniref:Ankyrin repeat domain 33Bb n=1 Tax=Electrophorus voltai TaxID=2609070 RepID=A0AAD9E6U4_9TELE|nr:hypothetical protein P4O66_005072 [Electrophorus voltai]